MLRQHTGLFRALGQQLFEVSEDQCFDRLLVSAYDVTRGIPGGQLGRRVEQAAAAESGFPGDAS